MMDYFVAEWPELISNRFDQLMCIARDIRSYREEARN
jgi:hypothetical protein